MRTANLRVAAASSLSAVTLSAVSLAAVAAALSGGAASAAPRARAAVPAGPITISVDATEAPRHLFHARQTIPAAAGTMTLAYPKWIPGEHAPTGPIVDVVGMRLSAGGKPLAWRRDPAEMYLIAVDVPEGAGSAITAEIDFVTGASSDTFTSGGSATAELAIVSWNQMLLYPAGPSSDAITVEAELRLPGGWAYGTSLEPQSGPPVGGPAPATMGGPPPKAAESVGPAGTGAAAGSGAAAGTGVAPVTIRFRPVSLTTLVDSPVLAGAHLRTLRLSPPDDPHPAFLHMAADSEAALLAKPEVLEPFRRLAAEAVALFGARHYDRYHFLLTLSDHTAHFGLEHHQSSDNRTVERFLVDDSRHLLHAGLLSHEMVHSWNGKYRRPTGLATPDYRQTMDATLLWVYEGLTNYLGFVLAGRSGLYTPEQARDELATVAATLDNRPGRAWRPLEDTAISVQTLYGASNGWESQRRSVDYYDEGTLVWLEADTIIRKNTGGARTLDDFCRLFHGGGDGPATLKPYTLDDVYAALNQVTTYDWKQFFTERVKQVRPRAPLGGIEASGWRLAYTSAKGPFLKAKEDVDDIADERFSLGFMVNKGAALEDVLGDTPAARSGLAPGMKVVAVNGRRYSRNVLEDATRLAKEGSGPVEILAEGDELFHTYRIDWTSGLRFPVLERDPATPDTLKDILKPRVVATPAPTK